MATRVNAKLEDTATVPLIKIWGHVGRAPKPGFGTRRPAGASSSAARRFLRGSENILPSPSSPTPTSDMARGQGKYPKCPPLAAPLKA